MSKRRNISGGPLDVPLLGRVIEPGEVADCPDFQPAHTDENPLPIIWPADKWELVPEPKVAPEGKRKNADTPPEPVVPDPAPEPAPPDQHEEAPKPVSSDPRER